MTENELQNNGRLYAIELLLTQALAERFRCNSDEGRVEDGARMMEEISANLVGHPTPVQTAALQTADRILKKALLDSTNLG